MQPDGDANPAAPITRYPRTVRADPVGLVEAIYHPVSADLAWLRGVVAAARPLLDAGFGVAAYFYDASRWPLRVWNYVDEGSAIDVATLGASLAATDRDFVARSWMSLRCATASEVAGYARQPATRALGAAGIADVLAVNAFNPDGRGCWLGAPLPKVRSLSATERMRWSRVSSHLAAALRMRTEPRSTSPDEAVLTPGGRLEHAEGPAAVGHARSALSDAVRRLERARGSLRRRAPDQALGEWRVLVRARWSLVDQFETGGQRYVVARANEPHVAALATLTPRELQVLAYAAAGHSNKLIAYELGISASTVRVLFARLTAKLGVGTRAAAVARWTRARG